jgi:hyperosmotically inducible periplasmic protein
VKRVILIEFAALLALGLAACDRSTTTAEKSGPAGTGVAQTGPSAAASKSANAEKAAEASPYAAAKSDAPADAALSEKVRLALVTERGINARDLDVRAQNGVVTLIGKVEEKSDQERMMLVAMSVDGVRSVVSNLVVERPA